MTTAARDYPAGSLRVCDADRDRALSQLSEAFQAGRITVGELDARSGQALSARTGEELTVLLADLPHDRPAARRAPIKPAHRAVALFDVIKNNKARPIRRTIHWYEGLSGIGEVRGSRELARVHSRARQELARQGRALERSKHS